MKWYKASNTITLDPTFGLIAKKTSSYKHEVLAVWFHLLEIASRKSESGYLGNIDHEEIELALELLPNRAMKIIGQMGERGLIKDGFIVGWGKFQIDPTNAERQKAYRERKKDNSSVTPSNSYVTENNAVTLEERRGEEIREDIIVVDSDFVKISKQIQERMKGRILNTQRVHEWIKAGADEVLILQVIDSIMAKRTDPPNTLMYFEQAIVDAIATKNKPLPAGKAKHETEEQQRKRELLEWANS